MNDRKKIYRSNSLEVREAENPGERIIEGYFIVFNDVTELQPGVFEQIMPEALGDLKDKDIRALLDHNSMFVLGRTASNTLELKLDDRGLYGRIKINENDLDAVNAHERVKRGDISQCSFSAYILSEETDERSDGSYLFTINELDLIEVSVVTFPAYANTSVEARNKDINNYKERTTNAFKNKLKERIKKWH